MTIDKYTKFILTLIMIFLFIIAIKDILPIKNAFASNKSDISYCWDGATINKVNDRKWKISTYC